MRCVALPIDHDRRLQAAPKLRQLPQDILIIMRVRIESVIPHEQPDRLAAHDRQILRVQFVIPVDQPICAPNPAHTLPQHASKLIPLT